jgi:hypothetical protein
MVSASERALIQCCEGDLMVEVYDDDEFCRKAVHAAIANNPCP